MPSKSLFGRILPLCLFTLNALISFSQSISLPLFHRDMEQEKKWNGLRSNQKVSVLEYDQASYKKLKDDDVSTLEITLPTPDKDLKLSLVKNDFLAEGFFVSSDRQKNVPYNSGVHYRGKIVGEANSMVAISFFDNEVIAVINESDGTQYTVGASNAFRRGSFVAYNATQADAPSIDCKSESLPGYKNASTMIKIPTALESRAAGGCVNIYFELGQSVYANKNNSVTEATNYLTGIFNVVSTLYNNDGVTAKISQILVWTTPEPYAATADAALTTFGQAKQLNFNGQLAQLVRLKTGGSMSGIAWVNVLCSGYGASQASGPFSYAEILPTYNSLPTFSWTSEVITHELGHNLGSPHTQSCSWTGGPIDNCVAQEGTCNPGPSPTNGGTIMSYCHLVSSIGINFNNGFGPQPKALILSRIASASCVVACSTSATCNVPTGLSTTSITTVGATLNWAAVSGALNYSINYKAASSSTWLPLSASTTATSIALGNLAASTAYNWQVRTNCSAGNSSYSQLQFTTASVSTPSCVSFPPTGLTTTNIGSTTATLSWNASTAAVNYNLYIKTTSSTAWILLLANTTSLSVNVTGLSSNTAYQWQVQGNCVQGSSAFTVSSFTTSTSTSNCTTFPPIGLTSTSINSSGATLGWTAVSTATSYAVQYKLQSSGTWITLIANTTAISVGLTGLQASSAYDWQVRSNCSAGSSIFTVSSFVTPATSVCTAPVTLTSSSITNTTASVTWSAASGAFNYTVDIKDINAVSWTNLITTTSLSVNITGLAAGTTYQWRVKTNCSSGASGYAQAQFVTTGTVVVTCNTPSSLASSSITTNSGTVSWAAATNALNYSIEYKLSSSATWIVAQSAWTSTSYSLTGLTSNTVYDWHVRTNCSGGNSSYVAAQLTTLSVASTACPGSLDEAENGTTATAIPAPFNTNILGRISPSGDNDYYSFVVNVGGSLTVTLSTLPADYDLRVLNTSGATMGLSQNGGLTSESMNLNLSAGTYYVRVYGWSGANNASTCYTLKVQANTASIEFNSDTHFNPDALSTTVFPNPANTTLNYRILGLSGPAELTITDLQGRQLISANTKESNSQLNVSSLSAGFYFLRVQDENKKINVVKFLKTL